MLVVFEGIDGSGKTTLSNLVAHGLRERGLVIEHVRENGRFASCVTQAVRELGRDARNLALTPRAELMLYLTREVQLFEDCTRPALEQADIVIADRFFYTAQTLAMSGRGMPASTVLPLVGAAMNGVVPDLVILVDVDPDIARARRRVSKLIAPRGDQPPSRKGLAGTDLQRRLRTGYLTLAHQETARWHVVNNTDADLHTTALVLTDMLQRALHLEVPERPRSTRVTPPGMTIADRGGVRAGLLAWIDRRAASEPGLAAYFLAGLAGPEIDRRRFALARTAPAVVASGLRGLDDEVSWRLRAELAVPAPGPIARSVSDLAAKPASDALLRSLVEIVPRDVSAALWGRDDAVAWKLRERMPLDAAMVSLGGVAGTRAWAMRERWLSACGGLAAITEIATAELACKSVQAIGDERAWEVRSTMREHAPVAALAATFGLVDDRAWVWRERCVDRAPKVVMRTIDGLDDPRAWTLRHRVAGHCEEMLDSIVGLDVPSAWELRSARISTWPASVLKSLGPLGATPRGTEAITKALARAPESVGVWRQALLAEARARW